MRMLIASMVVLMIVAQGTVAGADSVQAGAAKVNITPEGTVYIAGYGQNRLSTGIHDSVWARCLVLEMAGKRVAFLCLDLIGLFLDEVEVIRQGASSADLLAENIIISCTHNHEGPDTLGLWGPETGVSGVDSQYRLQLREGAVKCIRDAVSRLAPARLRVGQISVPGVSKNARDPSILDPVLVALKAEGSGGKTVATLVNFPNHPEALGSRNTLISSDWPHYMYEVVEKELGGVCLLQNAALGGMVTPDVRSHSFQETERVGTETGLRAIECLRDAEVMKCPNITHRSANVKIPVENQGFLELRRAGVIDRAFRGGKVQTELHLIKFGDVEMVTLPGEALPKVGLAVKELMTAEFKVLIGLGNDELGYIIPEEDFDPSKYEESMSVGPKAAPIIQAGLAKLLSGEDPTGGATSLLLLVPVLLGGAGAGFLLRRRPSRPKRRFQGR